jgi:hypothetical protein
MTGVLSPICGARSRCRIIRSSHFSSQKQSCELAHQRILFRRFGRFAFFRPFSAAAYSAATSRSAAPISGPPTGHVRSGHNAIPSVRPGSVSSSGPSFIGGMGSGQRPAGGNGSQTFLVVCPPFAWRRRSGRPSFREPRLEIVCFIPDRVGYRRVWRIAMIRNGYPSLVLWNFNVCA